MGACDARFCVGVRLLLSGPGGAGGCRGCPFLFPVGVGAGGRAAGVAFGAGRGDLPGDRPRDPHVPVSVEEFASRARRDGVPPGVQLLTYLFTEVLDGRNACLTDGLRGASGREPRPQRLRQGLCRNRRLGQHTMSWVLYLATLASALGCGVVAGVFFAFSAFVMPALKRLKPAEGIAAMQAISVAAVTPAFMTVLFGTAAVCGALALLAWDERSAPYLLSGGAVYLVGTILLTIVYHVPRNEALAKIEPRRRRRELLEALPLRLDRVEPFAGRHLPRRGCRAHSRAPRLGDWWIGHARRARGGLIEGYGDPGTRISTPRSTF